MLSVAITSLFFLVATLAVAVIVHSLRQARAAWSRLMLEGKVMHAELALAAAARQAVTARIGAPPKIVAAPRRAVVMPRPVGPRPVEARPAGLLAPRPAFAAA